MANFAKLGSSRWKSTDTGRGSPPDAFESASLKDCLARLRFFSNAARSGIRALGRYTEVEVIELLSAISASLFVVDVSSLLPGRSRPGFFVLASTLD